MLDATYVREVSREDRHRPTYYGGYSARFEAAPKQKAPDPPLFVAVEYHYFFFRISIFSLDKPTGIIL